MNYWQMTQELYEMDDALTLIELRKAEEWVRQHRSPMLKAHPYSCAFCTHLKATETYCARHEAQIPPEWIPKGCDAFADLIPF